MFASVADGADGIDALVVVGASEVGVDWDVGIDVEEDEHDANKMDSSAR